MRNLAERNIIRISIDYVRNIVYFATNTNLGIARNVKDTRVGYLINCDVFRIWRNGSLNSKSKVVPVLNYLSTMP
jgi:hypothetical protein